MDQRPIGLFDSGVGGLSILKEVRKVLPDERLIYFADQAHVPYGPRPTSEIRRFSEHIAALLLGFDIKFLIVACNTASNAALPHLRKSFPQLDILGMEFAVELAARSTRNGVVGMLATSVTLQGSLFHSIKESLGAEIKVVGRTPHGLVERIEAGDLDGPAVRSSLEEALAPMQAEGMDTLVLACTHYPFITPSLHKILGDEVQVVDPAPTIARQTKRLLGERRAQAGAHRQNLVTYITSGEGPKLLETARRLVGIPGELREARWRDGNLELSHVEGKQ
jgi:glutamate racemase